jgi:hypothetical protein
MGLPRWCSHHYLAYAVGKKTQGALGSNFAVQLAHSPGGGVTWIDKGFFAFGTSGNFCALAFVQLLKIIAAHIDLAAYF